MANGLFAGGSGTELDPFLIEDAHDLNEIRNNTGAHYKLINDIDLNISPYNENEGWTPINGDVKLNGNFYTIHNLYINRLTTGQALFGTGTDSIGIRYCINLYVKNASVTASNGAAILWSSGNGRNRADNLIRIENCHIEGNVYSSGFSVGLLAGSLQYFTIRNVSVKGSLHNTGTTQIGLLVGLSYIKQISNSYAIGEVNNGAAGFIGKSNNSALIIENSFSSVTFKTGTGYALIGSGTANTVNNVFWDVTTSGLTTSTIGVGLTTNELQDRNTILNYGWGNIYDNNTLIWHLKDGQYPKLWLEIIYKHLIKSNNQIFTLSNNQLIDTLLTNPTETDFLSQGFDDLNTLNSSLLSTLPSSEIEVLTYTDVNGILSSRQLLNQSSTVLNNGLLFETVMEDVNKIQAINNILIY